MKSRWLSFLPLLSIILPLAAAGPAAAAGPFRLGVPAVYTTPSYDQLIAALAQKGLEVNKNLQIVAIDLGDSRDAAGQEQLRREIAGKCDLFFATGDYLKALIELDIRSPLLFLSVYGPQHRLPPAMQASATGIFRDSADSIFSQSAAMLPAALRSKLGLIHYQGARMAASVPGFQEICRKLGIELIARDYRDKADIGRVMTQLKQEGAGGVVLFPPALRPGDLPELVQWQQRLKLPVLGQFREDIEAGLLGGPAMDYTLLMPVLADYAAKMLRGRSPAQLPVRYYSGRFVVNLAAASKLGIEVPREVLDQAEVIGFATRAREQPAPATPPVPGTYRLGVSANILQPALTSLLKALAQRGYVEGDNLHLARIDFSGAGEPARQQQIAAELAARADVFFATGNVLPELSRLAGIRTPVCFKATRETATLIPAAIRGKFTGVIRGSLASMLEMSQHLMAGAKRMALLARTDSNLQGLIDHYRRVAASLGISISFRLFSAPEQIGPLMRELAADNDFVLLFPPSITAADLSEVVAWQDRLRFPVLSQERAHIEAGLLAGPVLDEEKTAPKLAEYIDRLLQGRDPSQLPDFYYPEKYVINLRAASLLRREIPAEITAQAEIIREAAP